MPSELIKIIQIMKDGYNMMLKWPNLIRKKKKKELKLKGKLEDAELEQHALEQHALARVKQALACQPGAQAWPGPGAASSPSALCVHLPSPGIGDASA